MKSTDLINSLVTVTVDRPLGSVHPKHDNIRYPVNYGYIKGVMAPDGEEQDAYILGVNEPVTSFTGKVAAIIHRKDDVEDKWVVIPAGTSITWEDVLWQTGFQEQYFSIEIEMLPCAAPVTYTAPHSGKYLRIASMVVQGIYTVFCILSLVLCFLSDQYFFTPHRGFAKACADTAMGIVCLSLLSPALPLSLVLNILGAPNHKDGKSSRRWLVWTICSPFAYALCWYIACIVFVASTGGV